MYFPYILSLVFVLSRAKLKKLTKKPVCSQVLHSTKLLGGGIFRERYLPRGGIFLGEHFPEGIFRGDGGVFSGGGGS